MTNRTYTKRERYYTDGNTVRKTYVEEVPVRTQAVPRKSRAQAAPVRKQSKAAVRKPAVRRAPVRKTEKVAVKEERVRISIDYGYVATMLVAAAVIVFLGISYLSLQSKNNACLDTIAGLESQITSLTADNNALELDIYSSIDYNSIYDRAVELGMTHPTDNQVIAYNRDTLEYVKQYEDVPTNN